MTSLFQGLHKNRAYLFDGSFSEALQEIGFDSTKHKLWTSGASDQQTREVYENFKTIRCQIVSTNTYHASQILVKRYLDEEGIQEDPRKFLLNPIRSAFDVYQSRTSENQDFPIILGSLGPYGVSLRDASEYHGNYVDQPQHLEKISQYQEEHFKLLRDTGINVILYETIPADEEAMIFLNTIKKLQIPSVISFSCKDDVNLCHGTPLKDTIARVLKSEWIYGIGINCTNPKFVPNLLKEINAKTIPIPIFVYPNSGETWNSEKDCYLPSNEKVDWLKFISECYQLGANVFGGCCGVGTVELKKIAQAIENVNKNKDL